MPNLPVKIRPGFLHYKAALPLIEEACQYVSFVKSRKKENKEDIYYFDAPGAFDIEVTSTEVPKHIQKRKKNITVMEPVAFMYIWQFEINGIACYGRTWDEWTDFMDQLKTMLELDATHRLIIGVHNLAYEFQFCRKRIQDPAVFAVDARRPVSVKTSDGFEYRCTYILSGYGLKKVGEQLPASVKVTKLEGDKYDYDKVRTSVTPLTDYEMQYCENDVRIVGAYLRKKRDEDGDMSKILLTNTSYVRQYVRRHTIYNADVKKRSDYAKLMKKLTLEEDEYYAAHRAFSGGFTHANPQYVGQIIEDVDSNDFTSEYPSVMIAELYPMSKGKRIDNPTRKEIQKYTSGNYLSLLDIKITSLKSRIDAPDNILSISKCFYDEDYTKPLKVDDCISSNGRIVELYDDTPVYTTMTSIDLHELLKFYDPKTTKIEVKRLWYYKALPLPTEFVKCIIHFYKLKTELKGVKGKEDEYQWAKGMLNALYGMCVTNILRDVNEYVLDEWDDNHELTDLEKGEALFEYNTSKSRFLSYLWGVFVTAYARRNVYSGLLEFGQEDYIYADTDSNKVRNIYKHMTYINNYNMMTMLQIESRLKQHGIDPKDASPLDIHGKAHPLGVWDWETENNNYLRFLTLGAKRYFVEMYDEKKDGTIDKNNKVRYMTVAGLPKKALKNIEKREGKDIFEVLTENMYLECDYMDGGYAVQPEDTTKKLLTYLDDEFEADITDYLGNTTHIHELSAVHMSDNGFNFGLDAHFIQFLAGIQTEKVI